MTTFTFDSKQAGSSDFAALPEGNYECIIESGAVKKASTGTEYIDFKLKVRDDVEGQSYGGRVLWGKLYFTENTVGVVHGFLKAIGTPEGKDFGHNHVEAIKNYATGRAVLAVVGQREYNGQTQNEVKYMNASKNGGGKIDSPFDSPTETGNMNDPFSNQGGPIEVSDSDLPF